MYDLKKIDSLATSMSDFERDCSITVAMKIVYNTCKMNKYEKNIFLMLYNSLERNRTNFFESSIFDIIKNTHSNQSKQNIEQIKKFRENAMAYITQPKMKAFKAKIREKLSY